MSISLKIILIGDSGVGKSTIISTLCDEVFKSKYQSTIGIDFRIKHICVDDKYIRLQIWDTAGQERYRAITTSYLRGSNIVLLVFDLTSRTSFNSVVKWLDEIKYRMAGTYYKIFLIGNKNDSYEYRVISNDEAKKYADDNNLTYLEMNSKDSDLVNLIFKEIVTMTNMSDFIKEKKKEVIDLNPIKINQNSGYCC